MRLRAALVLLLAVFASSCRRAPQVGPEGPPPALARLLPQGLEDADAAQEYRELRASLRERPINPAFPRPMTLADSPRPMTPAEVRLLDAALRKSRSTLGLLPPASVEDAIRDKSAGPSLAWLVTTRLEGTRRLLFAWHLAQDWDADLWVIGANLLERELARFPAERDAVLAELRPFERRRQEREALERDASDPSRLPALLERLSRPEYRRLYGTKALYTALWRWTPAERAAKRPDPARARFYGEVAALEPRLAPLAQAYAALLPQFRD